MSYTERLSANIGGLPPLMNLTFALGGAVIAWRMTETLGRIAWVVFTLHHGIHTVTALWGIRIDSRWDLGLVGLFAVLATGSGARIASYRAVLIAVCIFLAATVAVFGGRYYAGEVLGNHSVIQ